MKILKDHFFVQQRRMKFNSNGDCIRRDVCENETLYVGTKAMEVIKKLSKEKEISLEKARNARLQLAKMRYEKDSTGAVKKEGWQFFGLLPTARSLEVGCQSEDWATVRKLIAMRDRAMKKGKVSK